MMKCSNLAGLVEGFFIERLMAQRRASPQTISSYRDAFRLLFAFAQERLGKTPSELRLQDLDASFLSEFLDHLERDRHNTVRSRNARLAALHSFFRYAALQYPEHSALIQRVLAMPSKRYEHPEIADFSKRRADDRLVDNVPLSCPRERSWQVRPPSTSSWRGSIPEQYSASHARAKGQ
jgi:integrase/recombinase XerD